MKTLVVASHKGGTGKTTTAVTLGHLLARQGAQVLLVDLDAQGNCADFMGLAHGPQVYQALIERQPVRKLMVDAGPGREGLYLLPSGPMTAKANMLLAGETGREGRLRRALAGAGVDWVIIDTAPSLNLLQVLAFVAADFLLVPTELAFASGLGVAQVLRTVDQLREDLDLRVQLAGILPTRWDQRLNETDAQLKTLVDRFPGKVWLPIPVDARAVEAPAYGSTLVEYAPRGAAMLGRNVAGRAIGGYVKAAARLRREVECGTA